MIITICGSMSAAQKMLEVEKELVNMGHTVHMPMGTEVYGSGNEGDLSSEGYERKIEYDLIRRHARLIEKSDAILVVNMDKRGIENYIGGNSFLEIGFAHLFDKKIFLLNDIPEQEFIKEEIEATQPVILNGDVGNIR